MGSARVAFDPDLVVPDKSLSLAGGAVAPRRGRAATVTAKHRRELAPFAATHEFRWNTPLESLKPQVFDTLFAGEGSEFPGILGMLDREFAGATTPAALQRWEKYRGIVACPACHGSRLAPRRAA